VPGQVGDQLAELEVSHPAHHPDDEACEEEGEDDGRHPAEPSAPKAPHQGGEKEAEEDREGEGDQDIAGQMEPGDRDGRRDQGERAGSPRARAPQPCRACRAASSPGGATGALPARLPVGRGRSPRPSGPGSRPGVLAGGTAPSRRSAAGPPSRGNRDARVRPAELLLPVRSRRAGVNPSSCPASGS
jgi:hypothetical protein